MKQLLRELGYNQGDALRALRDSGPLDSLIYKTTCKQCGKNFSKPLRWFIDNDFICTCGGGIDGKPLSEALIYLHQGGESLPDCFRIHKPVDDNSQ